MAFTAGISISSTKESTSWSPRLNAVYAFVEALWQESTSTYTLSRKADFEVPGAGGLSRFQKQSRKAPWQAVTATDSCPQQTRARPLVP